MQIDKETFLNALKENRIFFTLAYMDRKKGKRGWRVYMETIEGIIELKNMCSLYKPYWSYYRLWKAKDSCKTILLSIMHNLGISEVEVNFNIKIL